MGVRSQIKPSAQVRRCERLINLLRRSCGCLPSVRIAEAKFKLLLGKYEEAEDILHLLDANADIYMLQATVEIEKQNFRNARRYLDSAIAIEFNIQSKPKFQYLSGQVALLNSNFTESITQFERAIKSGHLSESESIASHLKLAQ